MLQKKSVLITIIIALVTAGIGFFAGMRYEAYVIAKAASGAVNEISKSLSGLGDTATNEEGLKTAKIGEKFTAGDFEITVLKVTEPTSFESTYGTKATPKNGKFVAISLDVKNLGKKSAMLNNAMAKLKDTSGREFDFSSDAYFTGYSTGESAYGDELQPSATGKVLAVFDVPKDATPDQLLMTDIGVAVSLAK